MVEQQNQGPGLHFTARLRAAVDGFMLKSDGLVTPPTTLVTSNGEPITTDNPLNIQRPVIISPRLDRFYRMSEEVMWQFNKLNYAKFRPDLLTQEDVDACKAAMLVESHNPVYTAGLHIYYRLDHEMTSFVGVWSYEELKHYLGLRTYLEMAAPYRPDLIDIVAIHAELDETRAGPWGEDELKWTRPQTFTYTMLQEVVTGIFYKRFRKHTKEPFLQDLLGLIGKDEYRHCQFYLEKAKEELDMDKNHMDEIVDLLLMFQMPGPTFIKDYGRHGQAMLKVSNLDLSALREVLDKVGNVTGKMQLIKLATDARFQKKLREEWHVNLGDVVHTIR